MVAKGKVKVCKIEYETKDRTNWKAVVLAYSMEEAVAYVRKNVASFDRYISTSVLAEVDAFEDTVYRDFFVGDTKVVETIVKSNDVDGDAVTNPVCPWCQKEFKSNNTLGIHIKKYHMT